MDPYQGSGSKRLDVGTTFKIYTILFERFCYPLQVSDTITTVFCCVSNDPVSLFLPHGLTTQVCAVPSVAVAAAAAGAVTPLFFPSIIHL